MPAPDAISADKLFKLIGTPKAPLILDVRREARRRDEPRLIPTARSWPDEAITTDWLLRNTDGISSPVVVTCEEGHGRSQGGAAWMRAAGIAAEYLEGGQAAWVGAGLPTIDPGKITGRDAQGRSLWVTRSRPKIDRIACPWLIRRFIDPEAVILFVAPSEVQPVAEAMGGMEFDIEDTFWSHRGETCTFDTILTEFGLSHPALDRLATIVRGADTARPDLAPECAGLLAASLGLSRLYSDDLAQLEAGMALYDAFYRWARDATEETHNWPAPGKGAK